jgi:phosphoribosyl 1,2-cyclic phosphate phosphodiesterase
MLDFVHRSLQIKADMLQITILGSGTSQGVPLLGCDCEVCRSTDPRDARTRCSIYVDDGP